MLRHLLVNGKLTVMFEKNPSGGCLMKGIESEGVMIKDVPGGSASLPSFVIHIILFCLEWGISFSDKLLTVPVIVVVRHTSSRERTSIQNLKKNRSLCNKVSLSIAIVKLELAKSGCHGLLAWFVDVFYSIFRIGREDCLVEKSGSLAR